MREKFDNYTHTRPRLRKMAGWVLVLIGILGILVPVVPGAPLLFFGLEILGLRLILTDKIKRVFVRKEKTTPLSEALPQEAIPGN